MGPMFMAVAPNVMAQVELPILSWPVLKDLGQGLIIVVLHMHCELFQAEDVHTFKSGEPYGLRALELQVQHISRGGFGWNASGPTKMYRAISRTKSHGVSPWLHPYWGDFVVACLKERKWQVGLWFDAFLACRVARLPSRPEISPSLQGHTLGSSCRPIHKHRSVRTQDRDRGVASNPV